MRPVAEEVVDDVGRSVVVFDGTSTVRRGLR
jgi:hypothetical protein